MNIDYNVLVDKVITGLKEQGGITLARGDVVAGGYVRDMILGRTHGDVDVFSPLRAGSKIVFTESYAERTSLVYTERDRAGLAVETAVYQSRNLVVDHKFYAGDALSCADITNLFICSICQCAFSLTDGLYMSPAFQRTMQTNVITFDPNIPNWNDADEDRPHDYHYKKMQEKFSQYRFGKFPDPIVQKPAVITLRNPGDS